MSACIVAGLFVAALVSGLIWFAYGKEYVIRIPQQRIQEFLDARFPAEKKHLLIFVIRYSNPKVQLKDGADRIDAGLDALAMFTVNNKRLSGSTMVSCGLRYEPSTGELHMDNSRIEQMSIAGIPDNYRNLVNLVSAMLLKEYLDRKPVYRITYKDVPHAIARLVLKKVQVKNGQLEVTMGVGSTTP